MTIADSHRGDVAGHELLAAGIARKDDLGRVTRRRVPEVGHQRDTEDELQQDVPGPGATLASAAMAPEPADWAAMSVMIGAGPG